MFTKNTGNILELYMRTVIKNIKFILHFEGKLFFNKIQMK